MRHRTFLHADGGQGFADAVVALGTAGRRLQSLLRQERAPGDPKGGASFTPSAQCIMAVPLWRGPGTQSDSRLRDIARARGRSWWRTAGPGPAVVPLRDERAAALTSPIPRAAVRSRRSRVQSRRTGSFWPVLLLAEREIPPCDSAPRSRAGPPGANDSARLGIGSEKVTTEASLNDNVRHCH